MDDQISIGVTDLSRKPKFNDNLWKNMMFIYACLIISLTLSLSINSINNDLRDNGNIFNKTSNNTAKVLDVFLTGLFILATSIIAALFIYLHINRHQTFEEANKENSKSSKIHFSMCGEKVGLYLRCGVVLIGTLSLVHIGLSSAKIKAYTRDCLNLTVIFSSITEMIFVIIQAAFILKYHSVVILKQTRLIKFGLYNIVIINITIWEISTVTKIKYAGKSSIDGQCSDPGSDKLFVYFLPAVSEYCVICMAIFYEIMKRLGKPSLIETAHAETEHIMIWRVPKAIVGIIIGTLISIICIGFTVFIIVMDKSKDISPWIYTVHNAEEMVLYIFSIVILYFAFHNTNKLKFSFTYLSNNVDKNLLFVSCFLSISFSVILSTYCFQYSFEDNNKLFRSVSALVEIFQIIFQTYVIQDAFYRCSVNIEQQKNKPGQNYLGILIGCNFGLWIFKSFQLKNGDVFFTQKSVNESEYLLTFFVYLTLPLSILYRYHSSSCLADVFSKIYQGEVCRFEGLLRAEGFDKCGMVNKNESEINIPQIVVQDGSPKFGRPRAITLPVIPPFNPTNVKTKKKMARRETIKNLEAAKLRVLSSHLSHNIVSKKLSATVSPTRNSSTHTLNDSDCERTPKQNKKKISFQSNGAYSDSEMPTIKNLIISNPFNFALRRQGSEDDILSMNAKPFTFTAKPISEHMDE